jgi:demethylmenaquinone methyltransferase/2-methoxy-6-polyprenyl-1,4-benzoquinol methylase
MDKNTNQKETGTFAPPHPPLQRYYKEESQRRKFVTWIFDETASEYDWIIRVMSFGSGNWYRKQALLRAGLSEGMQVLDVATGTAPVAKAETVIVGSTGSVIGLDRSYNMLKEAGKRVKIPLVHGGADQLPFANNSFDFISMGFALRHVDDLSTSFNEYFRVLKPGGILLIIELTKPKSRIHYAIIRFYLWHIVPLVARLGSGSKDAQTMMKYWWDTLDNCVSPATIMQTMTDCGFAQTKRHREIGLFSEYTAVKPNVE